MCIPQLDDGKTIGTYQYFCLHKAELNTKLNQKAAPFFRFVKFMGFNSSQFEKMVSANAETRKTLILSFLTPYEQAKSLHNSKEVHARSYFRVHR